ncbi:MAG: cyclic peptide export ABC transporter [Flavobacteriales bacterium]|nr:cyclic peptide export ABC transporter [Flavobacteriales bacterium]
MTIISGLSNALLLAVINYSTAKMVKEASGDDAESAFNFKFIIIFAIVFLIYIITKSRALKLTASFAENIVFNIRERIVKQLMNTELNQFEDLGRAEIYTRLTNDTNELSSSGSFIANGIQSAVLVFFAIIYLGSINMTAVFVTVGMLTIAISNYFISSKKLQSEIGEAISLETVYFDKLNEVTGGFKEIKLNLKKKYDLFVGKLQSIAAELRDKKILTTEKTTYYFVFAQAFFYGLLGVMVYVVPVLDKKVLTDLAKITPTILFIIIPLSEAIGALEVVNKATVAITNLDELEQRLTENNAGKVEDPVIMGIFNDFKKVHFNDLRFAYRNKEGQDQFSIGPIDFEVNRGDIIFIIGGNGSGKSTLVKLLTGLYPPTSGDITIDDTIITNTNIQEYRELYSVIFADFFLFSELYGVRDLTDNTVIQLLKKMQLSDKTGYKDGAFLNLNLSTGQRKRLAMIATILEDKNILVFDEWAADQDPEFRKYFYEELIFEFKKQGKTIIAITHDDHYFDKADVIYKMEYGKFLKYSK